MRCCRIRPGLALGPLSLSASMWAISPTVAKGIVFRASPPGSFSDWHIAPRRQYIITLSGEAEIGLADGTVHKLGAGDVNLAEDLTGHGHTTRVVGDVPRVTATVQLEE